MEAVECGAAALGDRPRLPRPDRAAGGAARRVRRLARRQQGQQHGQGRPQLRPERQGLQEGAGRAPVAQAAVHRVLELQPLRRGRGVRQARGLPQRPGQRPPRRDRRGVRPGLHRRGADLRARARVPARAGPGRACWRACASGCRAPSGRSPSSCWRAWRWSFPGLVVPVFSRVFVDQSSCRARRAWHRPAADRHGS